MYMKKGVEEVAIHSLDIKDELCMEMLDAGLEPKAALIASSIATKHNMDKIIDKVLGDKPASQITHNLSQIGKGKIKLSSS